MLIRVCVWVLIVKIGPDFIWGYVLLGVTLKEVGFWGVSKEKGTESWTGT